MRANQTEAFFPAPPYILKYLYLCWSSPGAILTDIVNEDDYGMTVLCELAKNLHSVLLSCVVEDSFPGERS